MSRLFCRVLIDPEPNSGAWNMAVDEALLESAVGQGVCSVRVYEWAEPTVSLGYFQPHKPPGDEGAADELRHLPVVRRLTGGGAILHHRELTYSCCVPADHPVVADPRRLYACVHAGVVQCLEESGLEGARVRGDSGQGAEQKTFLCFRRGDPNDVLLDGEKILGSAQRRRRGAVLQHGSLLLERSPHVPELPGLKDLRREWQPPDEFASRLAECIGQRLASTFARGSLTDEERALAHRLRRQRYANRRWTEKVRPAP